MPKKLVSSKRIRKAFSKNIWKILFVTAAIVLVTGAVVAKKLMTGQQAGIFEVKTGMPPVPSSSPVAAACISQISSFTTTGACALQGFKSITYVCTNGNKVQKLGDGAACVDLVTTLQEAQRNCGVICPSPTNAPPKPTVTPTPQVCAQEYGFCVSKKANPQAKNKCITYTDSCQKAANCASPFQKCGITTPR
jgi:hypothetical protein